MFVVLESGDEKVNGTSKSDVLLIAADPNPKFILAAEGEVAPVPPYATANVDPFQVPDVIVPTPVKLELVTVDFKVVPDNVPASATIVMSALPLNAVPLIFLEVANVVAVLALPVNAPVNPVELTELNPVTEVTVQPNVIVVEPKVVVLDAN